MTPKKISFLLIFFIALTAAGFISKKYSEKTNPERVHNPSGVTEINQDKSLVFPKGNSYEKEWKRADSLQNKGLTRSALDVVESILQKAKKENNSPQITKALIHKLKLESYIEEESYIKTIYDLRKETDSAVFPLKNILHSLLADVYWSYYQQNRWRYLNRTGTENFENEDIRTWDLKKILQETIDNYNLSLKNIDSLKRTPINYFEVILIKEKESEKYRPTLYDFLSHRAIDFFMHDESSLTNPAYKFELDNAEYFLPSEKFVHLKIETKDTLSLKFHAIKLLLDLLQMRISDSDPSAFIDADLKRLKFLKHNSIHENKDSLYLSSLQNLEKKYSSHPSFAEVAYETANFYYEKGISENSFGEGQMMRKAHQICSSSIKKFPESFGAQNCKYLLSRIEEKSLSFTVENVNVPELPFRTLVKYKNVKKVYFRIAKIDFDEYRILHRKKYGNDLINEYKKLKSVKEWSVNLPDDNDFLPHSTEIKIPELPLGHYLILAGTSPDFDYSENGVAYSNCWISNLSYISRSNTSDGSYDIYVFHRETGEPLKGVTGKLYYQKYDYRTRDYSDEPLGKYTTDENGYFNVPLSNDYRNFFIDFFYTTSPSERGTGGETDRLNTNTWFYQYKPYREKETRTVTHFFTDRSIYRPGQTIYFKGIVLETDGEKSELKKNFTTTVIFNDVNYQKVSELKLTTNEYGSFSGTFTAPTGTLTGQMHITDKYGYVYFSVEEYKRPKFEVPFDKPKGSYKLGEKITVKGTAKSYAGSAIDGAEVKYRVTRNAHFPYWYGYWRGGYPSSPQMEIANGTATANEYGKFEITFTAIPDKKIDKKLQPVFTYSVSADVTDIAGETRSGEQTVQAGYAALLITTDIPNELNKNEKDTFKLSTTNLAGEDEPAEVKISVWKLKHPEKTFRKRLWEKPDKFLFDSAEYHSAFPKDEYNDENDITKWERSIELYSVQINTEKTKIFSIKNLSKWEAGYYVLEAETKDTFGEEVKEIKYFTVFSPQEKTVPGNQINWFVSLKEEGEPGEKAAFLIGSKENNVKALYEIEHKGKIVKQDFILLNNEQKKIEIPIEEKHRGNFAVHFVFVKNSRVYNYDKIITVPHTDKMLDIEFQTFRNKLLPGQKEEWRVKVRTKNEERRTKNEEQIACEMLASMYDASLDAFRPHNWYFNILTNYSLSLNWQTQQSFSVFNSQLFHDKWNVYPSFFTRKYYRLNWFGFNFYEGYYRHESYDDANYLMDESTVPASGGRNGGKMRAMKKSEALAQDVSGGEQLKEESQVSRNIDGAIDGKDGNKFTTKTATIPGKQEEVKIRSNFSETAFFYPHLLTNEKGEIIISFTVPEALTRWKFNALAHTQDLKFGQTSKEIITQKELMVMPNAPRFFRESDKITFSAKVSNLSEKDLSGTAELFFYDATTMKEITSQLLKEKNIVLFSAKKGQSAPLSWELQIPEGISAITYKIIAKAGNFSDGEEMTIPVLTNRMLVTESLPLWIKGKQKKEFMFEKLVNTESSSTRKHHKLTLEFTSNPAWYAIQALPYLMEYPYDCSEQIFNRFYANSIAAHIANSSPKIKAVFDSWKNQTPDALLSNLEKNQELKSLFLEETPWVLNAKNETERKKRIALLFDLNKMSSELSQAINKLEKAQTPNGGWSWFPGMPDSRYITQYMVTGFGHLEKLSTIDFQSVETGENKKVWSMLQKAIPYLDDRIREDYEWLKKHKMDLNKNNLGTTQIQYLYARSYFLDRIKISSRNKEAFDYYKGQAQKFWLQNNRYLQGMIALALFRMDDKKTPNDIVKSLKENAIFKEELGMFWKEFSGGLYWYESPIEAQALFIEVFNEIAKDQKSVDEMRLWLLKNKQTNDWKTTKATAEACFALLLNGTDWLATESNVEISLGNEKITPLSFGEGSGVRPEAGTGYFKTSWSGSEINPEMGKVSLEKKDEGAAWGALYWQYFEQLDKITPHETPLNLNKKLFLEKMSDTGPVIMPVEEKNLKVGDKIKVRIELRVDRNMEFVHLKDMRASGFEPINVLSQYKWQDGLGYYESTRDAATNFFFDFLPKGTYVFEYPLRVTHGGDFSNGISTIQCMYAPEFASHSEGLRVKIGY